MKSNVLEKQFDDLTVINGIGEARQAWLQENLDITTYADLAALSADTVEAALRANRRFAARDLIEEWVETAEDLAAEQERESAVPPSRQTRFEVWQPFASFVVEFQERKLAGQPKEQRTKVHYMETDTETIWQGLAHADLSAWIKQQVGEPEPIVVPEAEPAIAKRPLSPAEPIKITVEQLVAWQPTQSATPQLVYEAERPFSGYLQAECPFTATLNLSLDVVPKAETTFAAELHARNLSTGKNVPLRLSVASVKSGMKMITAVLDEGRLPAGLYRFGLLFKQNQPRNIQFVELPRFQVV